MAMEKELHLTLIGCTFILTWNVKTHEKSLLPVPMFVNILWLNIQFCLSFLKYLDAALPFISQFSLTHFLAAFSLSLSLISLSQHTAFSSPVCL